MALKVMVFGMAVVAEKVMGDKQNRTWSCKCNGAKSQKSRMIDEHYLHLFKQ